MSIHPQWAEAIFQGSKTVELRRRPPAADTGRILLYATAPISALVGWFEVSSIEISNPPRLWSEWGHRAALDRVAFDRYFDRAGSAAAIVIGDVHPFDDYLPLHRSCGVARPPQNYQYLTFRDESVPWAVDLHAKVA